jgi:DNA-binding NtrC family response regulator
MDKNSGKILIVDDDPGVLQTAKFILKQSFDQVQTEKDPRKIPFLLSQEKYDVVLLDMNYQPGETSGRVGLDWLKKIKNIDDQISPVIITAYGEVGLAVEAMKIGAVDFIVKPWENEKFIATISSAWKLSQSRHEIEDLKIKNRRMAREASGSDAEMIGDSKTLTEVKSLIQKVAPTEANVMILGENGTGKELAARMIHENSSRKDEPFIKVDMGSLSASLFESELFGHVKGAFTDAKQDSPGRFEMASEGTLFLDEIGNIHPGLQVKLLSAIQNREIFRVGSSKPIPVNVRFVCATNLVLNEMVNSGDFREDLYYRLNTFEITMPPLRDRREDIPILSKHFLSIFSNRYRKKLKVSKEELKKLESYNWPGNIRELQHTIERAAILSEGPFLGLENIVLGNTTIQANEDESSLDDVEKKAIQSALVKYHGNMTRIAKELGVGRTTLYRKLKKYGL